MAISGQNVSTMQAGNRALALSFILRRGSISRSELAKMMGLTQASISKIVDELIEAGVVSEKLGAAGKIGRRRIELSLVSDYFHVIAVKLARRYFSAAVFDLQAAVLKSVQVKLPKGLLKPDDVMRKIKETVRSLLKEYPSVRGIGVAVPGPYLRDAGRIALMSGFSGWEMVDFQKELTDCFEIPVVVEHDTNAAVYAEFLYGSSERFKEHGTLVSFLSNDGVGAGVIEDSVILHGSNGIFGEVGHMTIDMNGPKCICGNRGCLETYCSAPAFAASVVRDLPQHPESSLNTEKEITAEVAFLHMRRGDSYAIQKVRELGHYIGVGLANIVYIYNPEKIILADVIKQGGDILLASILETVQERTLPKLFAGLSIHYSHLGEDPMLMGAAAIATAEVFKNPRMLYRDE